MQTTKPKTLAILQALLVAFLWSTSWVLIKWGLRQIPALTFAGLRYGLAVLLLGGYALATGKLADLRRLTRREGARLALLGVLFYALTQGAQFVALAYLPAVFVNLLLSLTSLVVAILGLVLLLERPGGLQWLGMAVAAFGTWVYVHPISIPAVQAAGYAAAAVGLLANAGAAILGRQINRLQEHEPLAVTLGSMGFGAAMLLGVGLPLQGLPRLSAGGWAIVGWLALVNTAFAFTLWNRTLQVLTAVESSVINNTMAIQIPILAILFLGERLTVQQGLGLSLTVVGTFLVQVRRGSG